MSKLTLDNFDNDFSELPNDLYDSVLDDNRGIFSGIRLTYPIIYNISLNRFIPGNNLANKKSAFMGWMINYNETNSLVDVLYRGFLFNEPLKISINLQEKYIQGYIYEQFMLAKNTIIENMPKIKKLKRINLKMITKQHALFIYKNLDNLIKQYEIVYGYEKSMILKA